MAPHFGQESRRPAHRVPNGNSSSANSTSLGFLQATPYSNKLGDDRARETQRKRDRQKRRNELKVGSSSDSTVPLRRPDRLADRVTFDSGDNSRAYNEAPDPLSCSQQGRGLQQCVTRDGTFSGDGGSRKPISPPDAGLTDTDTDTDTDTGDTTDVDADDFVDLFGLGQPPPRPPRQPMSADSIQYSSSQLHILPPRPAQASKRHDPDRTINTHPPKELVDDDPLPGAVSERPSSPMLRARATKKHPANPYKGQDPIKRRVQNKLLRCILADKPLPKPRKHADRMVLKCTGRQEFR